MNSKMPDDRQQFAGKRKPLFYHLIMQEVEREQKLFQEEKRRLEKARESTMPFSSGEFGELSDQSFVFREVAWKIPDFFSLPQTVDSVVESSSISFANATWRLTMYPNGTRSYRNEGFITVFIRRLWSLVSEHTVFYKIFIPTRDGTEFKSFSDSTDFNEENSDWGVTRLSSRSELETQRNSISSDGTVTVICQMRVKKNSISEAHSQTEMPETLGSTENNVDSPRAMHVDKLLHNFGELLLNEEHSDVTIHVKDQKFRAHRAILGARSSVFASMFQNDMKEKATGVVDVQDSDPDTFPDFLRYLYCGSVDELSGENVFSLHATADKYDVQELKSECLRFMTNNLSVDTFIDTITLCLRYSEAELLKLATDFFAKNLPEIIVTVKWQTFLAGNPTYSNELLVKALASDKRTNH